MTLLEIAPGVTAEDVKAKTEASYRLGPGLAA
jgi:acyl CoA:acetate/3-ketoacid CoA transferase beta subunit